MRKIFFITLSALLIFLIVLELCLRVCGYLYVQSHHPEAHAKTTEFSKDEFRILCLGDSFTLGMGAGPENSYPRQLEKLLQKNISKKINVINGGRFANTSSLVLKDLQEDINKYNPNILVVMIGVNNEWNLRDSSYFLLKKGLNLQERFEKILSGFRIYKLIKIGWGSFKYEIDKRNKTVSDGKVAMSIKPESSSLVNSSGELIQLGMYDLAEDRLKEALGVDKNNYNAYVMLARIQTNPYRRYRLAQESIWLAVGLVDEWNVNILSDIISIINLFDDRVVNRQLELIELRKYFQNNIGNKGINNKLVELINARLDYQDVFEKVMAYDLKKIASLARQKGVSIILQTYPRWIGDSMITKISKAYNLLLVDNGRIFEEMGKHEDTNIFFVEDGHCNAKGYRIIAENVYAELVNNNLQLTMNKRGEYGKY